ncbi:hypothetical protein [Prevotella ihumii]|uniref:hypothetical protein n=1 Tax=Prevotella ihumii TaxID=1917878 RepID=UPI000981E2EB|nr:hypothetical protein [Prevotella ihumii]
MLYKIAHILRDKFPLLWILVGAINSLFFKMRYNSKLREIPTILQKNSNKYIVKALEKNDCEKLEQFFINQPIEAFTYFKPHKFANKDLQQLVCDKSFLAYIVLEENNIVGYFFLRCTFMGKCYRGYITDVNHRRRGINKLMGICATEIAVLLNIRMFGSISPNNAASMKSAEAINEIKIIETLPNGDYLVAYLPRK